MRCSCRLRMISGALSPCPTICRAPQRPVQKAESTLTQSDCIVLYQLRRTVHPDATLTADGTLGKLIVFCETARTMGSLLVCMALCRCMALCQRSDWTSPTSSDGWLVERHRVAAHDRVALVAPHRQR